MRKAVYPGTFDPVTCGHVDIIERAAQLFDEIVVMVGVNVAKKPLFSGAERVEMIREAVAHLPNVKVDSSSSLLVEYCRQQGAQAIIKGLRALQDFEFEFQMAMANKKLAPELETVFLMTSVHHSFLSSTIIREIAHFGVNIADMDMVPPGVARRLSERLSGSPS